MSSPLHQLSVLISSSPLVSSLPSTSQFVSLDSDNPVITIDSPTNSTGDISDLINSLSNISFHLNFKYGTQVEMAIAILLMSLGVIFVLLGVRLFKYVLFTLSFIVFGGLTYFIVVVFKKDTQTALIAGSIVGFIFACILLKLWKLSLFACGACVGFVLWLGFKSLFPALITSDAVLYLLLVVPCLVCGAISVKLQKLWLLLATPILGSFLFAQGLDYFIKQNLNVFSILNGDLSCDEAKCFYVYGGLLAGSLIGMLIQWKYTSGMSSARRYADFEDEEDSAPRKIRGKKLRRIVYVDDD